MARSDAGGIDAKSSDLRFDPETGNLEPADGTCQYGMAFDRAGRRLDEVAFHPAYHELMALGLGAGDELRSPLAITVIGGLASATVLTLLLTGSSHSGCSKFPRLSRSATLSSWPRRNASAPYQFDGSSGSGSSSIAAESDRSFSSSALKSQAKMKC